MVAKIESIKPEGDFNDNNVYSITLDNGTTAKCYAKKGSYKDKRFSDGTAIGKEMQYELTAKGNFGQVRIGNDGNFEAKPSRSYNGSSGNDNRQMSIVRQSMLKAACTFLAGKPNAKSEHVFQLAETFVEWVNRAEASKPTEPEQHFTREEASSLPEPEVEAASPTGLPF